MTAVGPQLHVEQPDCARRIFEETRDVDDVIIHGIHVLACGRQHHKMGWGDGSHLPCVLGNIRPESLPNVQLQETRVGLQLGFAPSWKQLVRNCSRQRDVRSHGNEPLQVLLGNGFTGVWVLQLLTTKYVLCQVVSAVEIFIIAIRQLDRADLEKELTTAVCDFFSFLNLFPGFQ